MEEPIAASGLKLESFKPKTARVKGVLGWSGGLSK